MLPDKSEHVRWENLNKMGNNRAAGEKHWSRSDLKGLNNYLASLTINLLHSLKTTAIT